MVARWVQAKNLKIAKERRSAPRSLGVNWHNGHAVKVGSIDLQLEGRVAEEMETRKPRAPSVQELGLSFNGLKFFTIIDNTRQKLRLYFTPKKEAWYIVWWDYKSKKVFVSISYGSKSRAEEVWNSQSMRWKYRRKLA